MDLSGVYDVMIVPPEMSVPTRSNTNTIVRVFYRSARIDIGGVFDVLEEQGHELYSFTVVNQSRGPYDPKIETTVVRAPNKLKAALVRAHLASLPGIMFCGIINVKDIVVIHDGVSCAPDAVRTALLGLIGHEASPIVERLDNYETNLKIPLSMAFNSIVATLMPSMWILDRRLYFPFTIRSIWTMLSGLFAFLCLVDVNNLPTKTFSGCARMPGFVSGAQMRVLLSFILLFAGLFSLFLAVLIEHESSPKYSLRCIAFSNFVLTAPKIYDAVTPKLRSIFLSSVRTRSCLPLIDSPDSPGAIVSYKQGDIVLADCIVTSADYHARVSVPTFAQNQDPTTQHLSIPMEGTADSAAPMMASPSADETMACVTNQILYQGQQILSGICVNARVLQFSDLSLTRILGYQIKSASLTGAYWCYSSPRLKIFVRYFGTISIALFVASWFARVALDPDHAPDSDSFLINILPRVTLTATLICQCLSSTTLYDSVDVLLLYAKQAVGRKTAIVPHTVDLLRLVGNSSITLDIGDQDLISSGLVAASNVPSVGLNPTDEVKLENNWSDAIDTTRRDGAASGNVYCHRGELADQVMAAQSVFSLNVTVTSSSPRFAKQITNTGLSNLFSSWHLLPADGVSGNIAGVPGGLVVRLSAGSHCISVPYRKQYNAVFATLVSSRGYSTTDRNEIVFVEDLRGLIPLLYWADVCKIIYDRGMKFYVSSSASLALLALSTASYSTAADGVRLWVYTLAYFLLANSSLLVATLAMSFSLSLLRDSQISLDSLLNVVRMKKNTAHGTAGEAVMIETAKAPGVPGGILGQDLNGPPITSSTSNVIIDI